MIAGILMTPEVIQILMIPPMIARGKFNMIIPDKERFRNSW